MYVRIKNPTSYIRGLNINILQTDLNKIYDVDHYSESDIIL